MSKTITIELSEQPYFESPTRTQVEAALSGYEVLSSSVNRTEAGWHIVAEVEGKVVAKAKPKAKSKAKAEPKVTKSKSSKK